MAFESNNSEYLTCSLIIGNKFTFHFLSEDLTKTPTSFSEGFTMYSVNICHGNFTFCFISEGLTGAFCDVHLPGCEVKPCKNSATCVQDGPTYTCQCIPGYTGEYIN